LPVHILLTFSWASLNQIIYPADAIQSITLFKKKNKKKERKPWHQLWVLYNHYTYRYLFSKQEKKAGPICNYWSSGTWVKPLHELCNIPACPYEGIAQSEYHQITCYKKSSGAIRGAIECFKTWNLTNHDIILDWNKL